MPLNVNMAFRRRAFDIAGGWDQRIGRRAGTLLTEEVREWCLRARAKGLRGFYVPEMAVQHIIPPERLQRAHFRRWFYWRGVTRALLYQQQGLDAQSDDGTRYDFTNAPRVCGVPRDLCGAAARHAAALGASYVRSDRRAAFDHELWLCMFAGIARQRWQDRQEPFECHGAPRVRAT